jgi:4-alpha-glucanotransferase
MASELNLANADDWREAPNTPSNVRPQRWAERFTKTERQLADEAIAEFEAKFGAEDDDEAAA